MNTIGAIEPIQSVLAHWNYSRALLLFEQYGDNQFLLEVCQQEESTYTTEVLKEQLQNILESNKEEESIGSTIVRRIYAETPAVQQIVQLRQQAYRKRDYYHAQLGTIEDNLKRMLYAHRVLQYDEFVKACWTKLDYYEKYGRLPEETPVESLNIDLDMPVFELIQLYNSSIRYVSKYLDREDKQKEVAQRKALIEAIEKL